MKSLNGNAPILDEHLRFPDPLGAGPDGLVAIGGDLSTERLLLAYRSGIFPWTAAPLTWWSPNPRGVFPLSRFHVSRSLERVLERNTFRISLDRGFGQVIEGCAKAPGRGSTWISRSFVEAYTRLHLAGHAHSLECWLGDRLAGGIYGVAIGGFFAGESMFHSVSNASKVALFYLVEHLRRRGFLLFDVQVLTPITLQLGGVNIPRSQYLEELGAAIKEPCRW